MADKYLLKVTAGSSYDPDTHSTVPVNTADPLRISSEFCDVDLNVRIQEYRGMPQGSPSSSAYFDLAPHSTNNDQYSICWRFKLKDAGGNVTGDDLVFGNDFERPIRDRLPPGFSTAFRIVKWAIDPGLDGDVYGDQPYLYGPLGSSINVVHVGPKEGDTLAAENEHLADDAGIIVREGGSVEGISVRSEAGVPADEGARKKWFLTETNRRRWQWETGREYTCDFFNPYLDFNRFALRLPGFTLPIMKFWDGQSLRYVLKNRKTGMVYFVVVFTLYLKDDINDDGSIHPRAFQGQETRPSPTTSENGEIAQKQKQNGVEATNVDDTGFEDAGVD